jgi:hypothetical protein
MRFAMEWILSSPKVKRFLELAEEYWAQRERATSAIAFDHLQLMAKSYAALAEAQDQLERSFRAALELKAVPRIDVARSRSRLIR